MRRIGSHGFIWSLLLALALTAAGAVTPGYAQEAGTPGTAGTTTQTTDDGDDGFDMGWLGLLGLAGLLGLRRRDHVTHVDTARSTTRP